MVAEDQAILLEIAHRKVRAKVPEAKVGLHSSRIGQAREPRVARAPWRPEVSDLQAKEEASRLARVPVGRRRGHALGVADPT